MKNKTYRFTGGSLEYTVKLTERGVSCASVRDTKNNTLLFSGEGELLFITARELSSGNEITASSLEGWEASSVTLSGNGGIITLSGNGALPGVTVIVNVGCDDRFITFDTSLINNNPGISLYKCAHPSLFFKANRDTNFFYPYGCGEYKPSTIKGGWNSEQSYPSYGASMQYLCFWNKATGRGVYYGCHDPFPASKKLCCYRGATEKNMRLRAWQLLSDITSGGNSQKLCGSVKLCAFDGDWYDAALLYRDFIENEAHFTSEYDENGRKGVPEWLRETDCWFNNRVIDNNDFADFIIEQANKLGVKPAVHLYYWHQIPFDNDYPHYFPMKECVKRELEKLHAAGIKVMPYINGRLWDTRDRGAEDFEFTSVAKPYCTKGLDGKPITETYSSKETDGSKVELAVMCPSTTLWQDKVASIVGELFDTGFDGVYIDQIAAAEAKPCTDPAHKHPAGGGEWWCQAYNTMLERIAREKPADRMLTTECTADPFLRHLDGYLTWLWIKNEQVPAFPTVFSDKVITFGTDFRGLGNMDYGLNGKLDEAGVRVFAAQSFLYGQQMGWMTTELFSRMPHQDFYIRLVRSRAKFRNYFLAGKVLRPPVIRDDGKKIILRKCREAYNGYVESACVNGMLWQDKKTGSKVLLLINSGMTDVNAEVTSEIPDGEYSLSGEITGKVSVVNSSFSLKMPPLSLCYIELD